MPTLHASQIADLVTSTLEDMGEPDVTELAYDLTEHVAADELLTASNMEKVGAGRKMEWSVLVKDSESAANVGLFQRYTMDHKDGLATAEVEWAFSNFHWNWERRLISMNRSPRRIVNYLKTKRRQALIAWAKLLEANFWDFPSASDTDTPLGLPYWCHKSATEGFNGGIPTGYTTVAGLAVTGDYEGWNNYTFPYSDVTEDDFLHAMRKARKKTGFKAPLKGRDASEHGSGKARRAYYTNIDVIMQLERIARNQNENLGRDVTAMDNEVMVGRAPVKYVPKLDEDTTDPFYGIDWDVMKLGYLAGEWMVERTIDFFPDQPTVGAVHTDCQYAIFCYNRRKLFVGSTGVTYPS